MTQDAPRFVGVFCSLECPFLGKLSCWGRCKKYGYYTLQRTVTADGDGAFLREQPCIADFPLEGSKA